MRLAPKATKCIASSIPISSSLNVNPLPAASGRLLAQGDGWLALDGPFGGDALFFITAPNGDILTGSESSGGASRSTDEGATWNLLGTNTGIIPSLVTQQGVIYGFIVGIAGCMKGLQGGSDAGAVGRSATSAVVLGITLIIMANAIVDWLAAVLDI